MTILQRSIDHFPDLLNLHRGNPGRYPFLLESVSRDATASAAQNNKQSRWDILFAFPGQHLELNATGKLIGDAPITMSQNNDFLCQLDEWWQQEIIIDDGETELPFQGGWFIYLGYELAGQIEPVLHLPVIPSGQSQAMAVRCPAAILRDHEQQRTIIIAESDHKDCFEKMSTDMQQLIEHQKKHSANSNDISSISLNDFHEDNESTFLSAVARIKNYINEGDVFQVNLSRRWKGPLPDNTQAADIYQALRHHNPAPFAGLCVQPDWAIISSSPERLVCVDAARQVETRPIAGTRPRHDNHADDTLLSQELLQHPKERAEHIMLIDMERNDLGRVCQAGTIEVDELMVLESYSHVHHIVSNIRGRLRDEVTPGDVIRAVFPGGTITGCPKVRCMEIIAELEADQRGPYTGSMGYLNRNGSMDLNILIRSLVQNKQGLSLRAGAGIVADSIPSQELSETRTKARGLLLALGDIEAEAGQQDNTV